MSRGRSIETAIAREVLLDEEQLVSRAAAGDVPAYEELVECYQDVAFRTAYLITRDAATAEDAAQEGFIRCFRAMPRFNGGSPFRPWLLKVVANEARRRVAADRRHDRIVAEVKSHTGRLPLPSVEAQVLAGELRRELDDAIRRLTETDQMVLAYRFVLDLSEAEMAAAMNCRRGTVKSRLSRAIGRLRDTLSGGELELINVRLSDA